MNKTPIKIDPLELLQLKATENRTLYRMNLISREAAEEAINPYLDAVNEKSKELAKKHGQRHKPVGFVAFVR